MIADTSFLISLFVPMDDNHPKAVEIWNQPEVQDVSVPDRVIEEMVTVLTYKQGNRYAMETYEKVCASRNLRFRRTSEDEWMKTISRMKTLQKNMGFTDHLLLELASKTNERVLSFDRQILRELKK